MIHFILGMVKFCARKCACARTRICACALRKIRGFARARSRKTFCATAQRAKVFFCAKIIDFARGLRTAHRAMRGFARGMRGVAQSFARFCALRTKKVTFLQKKYTTKYKIITPIKFLLENRFGKNEKILM